MAGGAAGRGFEPWGATTGIGSLPHTCLDDALAVVAATCPEVPYWPQLPRAGPGGEPVRQALGPVAGLVRSRGGVLVSDVTEDELVQRLDDAATGPRPSPPAGLAALIRAVDARALPRARAVKGQLYGPITLAGLLRVDDRAGLRSPRLVAALARHVGRLARDQAEALAACGLPVLLFVDEPGLGVAEAVGASGPQVDRVVDLVLGAARQGGALAGLHLCSTAAAHPRLPPRADLVSLDVTGPAGSVGPLPAEGLVAWGAVPAGRHGPVALLAGEVLGHLGTRMGDPADALRRSLVTPACGLALVSPTQARAAGERARALSAHLRRVVLEGLPAGPAGLPA